MGRKSPAAETGLRATALLYRPCDLEKVPKPSLFCLGNEGGRFYGYFESRFWSPHPGSSVRARLLLATAGGRHPRGVQELQLSSRVSEPCLCPSFVLVAFVSPALVLPRETTLETSGTKPGGSSPVSPVLTGAGLSCWGCFTSPPEPQFPPPQDGDNDRTASEL